MLKHLMGYKAGLTVDFLLDRNDKVFQLGRLQAVSQGVTGVTFKKGVNLVLIKDNHFH